MSDLTERIARLSPAKRALLQLEGDGGTGTTDSTQEKSIAIIGMGCRFPGRADTPELFWRNLREGVDTITEIPPERWDVDAYYDPNPDAPGKTYVRHGAFLENIDQFDAAFFGISPREAASIDPQQRLLLEVSWEALEQAGQAPHQLAGSRTGVFVGIMYNDYALLTANSDGPDIYSVTGNDFSIAAGRLSYVLDLQGPSITVDTACSSSLVAIHLACSSLRARECDLALAGGVNLMQLPDLIIAGSKARIMAVDGRCKTFDAAADGYVRGEGCGIIVLKRLADAIAGHDNILALIRGSAVNHDGHGGGLTVPNPLAQQAVIRQALANAQVKPHQISYLEAHGTGTPLGDPIEVRAAAAVLSQGRSKEHALVMGSVKTNIGHLESAAGVAGLIKVVLALQHQEIPPHLHLKQINPSISLQDIPAVIPTERMAWQNCEQPRIAGISSFGIGGTNAHIVLQEAPAVSDQPARAESADSYRAYLLPLSARAPAALVDLAKAYQGLLSSSEQSTSPLLFDLCYTACVRRSHYEHRLAMVGHSTQELVEQITAFLQGETRPGMSSGCEQASRHPKLAFVFSGQGPQWWAMGRELSQEEPVFRRTLHEFDQHFRRYANWSVLQELAAEESQCRLDQTEIAQPALVALQLALAALWQSWGVVPGAVVGHSLGEVTAAYVAGILSLDDAARVIFHRGRLMQQATGQGQMAAVEMGLEEVQRGLVGYEDRLSIAACNSHESVVLSGDPAALEQVLQPWQERGISVRRLHVNYAFHSPQMARFQEELAQALRGLQPGPASIPVYSTATGLIASPSDFDAGYWGRQLRLPVLFAAAVDGLLTEGYDAFLELSPHPVLGAAISQCAQRRNQVAVVLPSLRRGEEERMTLLRSLGQLYTRGYSVDWNRLYPTGGKTVQLPCYPWQRERHWKDLVAEDRGVPRRRVGKSNGSIAQHPLIDRSYELAGSPAHPIWETEMEAKRYSYVNDHRFQGTILLPAAAYIEMALAAGVHTLGQEYPLLTDIEFHRALFLAPDESRTIQIVPSLGSDGAASFSIHSRSKDKGDQEWALHANGSIRRTPGEREQALCAQSILEQVQNRCSEEISGEDYYKAIAESGLEYGASLRAIEHIWRRDGEALAKLAVAQSESEVHSYHLHPAILDAALQVLGATLSTTATDADKPISYLPTRVARLRFYGQPSLELWSHATLSTPSPSDMREGKVQVFDMAGRIVLEIEGVRLTPLDDASRQNSSDWLYELQWQPKPHPPKPAPESSAPPDAGTWLIFADQRGVGERLATWLSGKREQCILVFPGQAYERIDSEHFRIRPDCLRDIEQVLNATVRDPLADRGIVHLWSLDTQPPDDMTLNDLGAAQQLGCHNVLHLAQAIAHREWKKTPALWLITQGAQQLGDSSALNPAQAPLWGLGRVIAQELPSLWGGLVDLDPADSAEMAAALLGEAIQNDDGETQIAFRQSQRYVARLVASSALAETGRRFPWRPDSSYLITGGLGDLGLHVARWMIQQGARRLVLLSRTELPARVEWSRIGKEDRRAKQIAAIHELEAMGASIHLASVDIADEIQFDSFLKRFREEGWPPIRGVIHAAGVLQDQTLLQLDAVALRSVMRPKVYGGWILHRLLRDAPLDFFVLFSSVASLLGSPGQGNYSAANAFLDALAHYRRAQGLPALSVNWGPWKDSGMAARTGGSKRLAMHGIDGIPSRDGLDLLGRLIRRGSTQIGAIPIHWFQFRQAYPVLAESPLLATLARERTEISHPSGEGVTRPGLRASLLALSSDERERMLETFLTEQFARVLGAAPSRLDRQQPLNTLGLDSLMIVQLKNSLERETGIAIPLVKLLQGASISELTMQVSQQLAESTPTPTAVQVEPPDANQLLAQVDQLSDTEVDSLLDHLLTEGEAPS